MKPLEPTEEEQHLSERRGIEFVEVALPGRFPTIWSEPLLDKFAADMASKMVASIDEELEALVYDLPPKPCPPSSSS